MDKFAFRCRTCGKLHTSDHAAEASHPHACSVCGAGVIFQHSQLASQLKTAILASNTNEMMRITEELQKCGPATKQLVPENWEILSDVSSDRLNELSLSFEQVVRHQPWLKSNTSIPQHHSVSADESLKQSDTMKS